MANTNAYQGPERVPVNDTIQLILFDKFDYIQEYYAFILNNHDQFSQWLPFLTSTPPTYAKIFKKMEKIVSNVRKPCANHVPYRIEEKGKLVGIVGFLLSPFK